MQDLNLRPLVHKAQNLQPSSAETLPLRHCCICLPQKIRYAGFEPATSRSQGIELSTELSFCATMAYASDRSACVPLRKRINPIIVRYRPNFYGKRMPTTTASL